MKFHAYVSSSPSTKFSFEGRDDAKGIRGKLESASTPVVDGDSLDDLRQKARAYVAQCPSAVLYLADADKMVYETMIDKEYHDAKARAVKRKVMAGAILVFGVTSVSCIVAKAMVLEALWMFAGASVLYLVVVLTRVFNEIEGALVTEILLVLALALVPILRHMSQN